MENYVPRNTKIGDPATSITMLPHGEIAFLSESQFVIFDGTQWSTITELDRPTHFVQVNGDQFVVGYVGGMKRLTRNDYGGYNFEQLSGPTNYPGSAPSFRSITSARGYIFGSHGTYITTIAPDGALEVHQLSFWVSAIFSIGDEIYTTGGSPALLNRWDWESKKLVDCQNVLDATEYIWFTAAQPRREGGVWLLNESNRIIGYDGTKTWYWEGNDEIEKRNAIVQCFVETGPDQLAIGTSVHGALVFDEQGRLSQKISTQHGLDNVSVLGVGTDEQNGLWISTKRSVSRVQLNPDILIFDERHGIRETVDAIEACNDRLYLATASGLYVNNPQATSMQECFVLKHRIPGVSDILAHRGKLFVAASNLVMIDENDQATVLSQEGATNLWTPSTDPDLVLAGNYRGVLATRFSEGVWGQPQYFEGPEREIYGLAENSEGVILGSMGGQDFAKITLDADYGHYKTLPIPSSLDGVWSMIVELNGQIYVNSRPSMRWDTARDDFVPSPEIEYYVGGPPYGFEQVFGTSYEDAWVSVNARRGKTLPRPNNEMIGQISSINDALETRAHALAYDTAGRAWAGGNFGLVLSLKPQAAPTALEISPRIHRIISIKSGETLPNTPGSDGILRLGPKQNSLRVEAAFPQFFAANQNQLQITLEGFDQSSPEFDLIPFREFTNVPPGSYTLTITSLNSYGQYSTYSLPIFVATPLFLQPLAFAVYLVALLFLISFIVFLYSRHQIRKSKRLENLVAKRTRELEQQAVKLAQQNEELEEKTEELTATTETLTSTLNQLQEMQTQLVDTARTAGKAEIAINVLHNVGNVLNSLNVSINVLSQRAEDSNVSKLRRLADLLDSHQSDISDFLSTDPKGKNVPTYLIHLADTLENEVKGITHELGLMGEDIDHVKSIIAAQQTHAKSDSVVEEVHILELCQTALNIVTADHSETKIEIINEVPADIAAENDKHRVLDIVLNLISNAIDAIEEQKPELGVLTLQANRLPDGEHIEFQVKDNGSGIAPENLEKLFRHGFTTKAKGHGFGLHSCANAAKSLGGELTLNSPGKGQGATATLSLPIIFQNNA